jgi:putative hemolysin
MEHLDEARLAPARTRRNLSVGFARDDAERRAAQRLRWRVFAEEMGARLASAEPGIDRDEFDPWCEHMVVRDQAEVIGTYRLLSPQNARRAGGYYSEGEFDLERLEHLRGGMVEVGRSCIDARYRSGAVIALLWAGLARYMLAGRFEYLVGCASMSVADGGRAAATVYKEIRESHLAPMEYRVFPRHPLSLEKAETKAQMPPLLKGYLRLGAYIAGEPAWDPDFNTADFFVLLPLARVERRYARHFLGVVP